MNGPREAPHVASTQSAASDPAWAGLHYLIEQAVEQQPEAEALRFGGQALSYAELNRRANQCAHYLRELGVGPDVLVGVLMDRSIELAVGLLAILKAGGAYLPLALDCPAERIGFMLRDAGVALVLTRTESAHLLEGFGATALSLEAAGDLLAGMPENNPPAITGPQNLAYVIYTSGSTGKPKGCLIEHASICNRLLWMRDFYRITAADRILQKTPHTFDVSVWEFFLPLIAGSSLVVAKPGGHKDNRYLKDLIQGEGVTVCHFVPSMLRFFLRQEGVDRCATLRHVFASGEALPYGLMSSCLRTLPAKLHNLYGPTEAAVDVTYWECAERPDQKTPIGRPISHTQIYILDDALRPVPDGEAGELFIGGIGVARGYLNRPELTRERFVRDPFSPHPGARLYRTGDKARIMPDGQIEYLGRLDFQVKLRGLRIELSEIEETLRRHEAIEDAAVLVRDEQADDPKLVAYVVFRRLPLSTKEVRDFTKRTLPEYMAPNQVVALKEFPINGNGKLDRKALPWPVSEKSAATGASNGGELRGVATPASVPGHSGHAMEKVFTQLADAEMVADIRGLFQKALRTEALPETGDLFDLGATSFTMVQAVDYIQTQYGVAVPVDVFFDNPTVQEIAEFVRERTQKAPDSALAGNPSGVGCCGAAACQPPAAAAIALEVPNFREEAYARGTAASQFSGQPVSLASLGQLLSLLRCHPERTGPRHLYSSAGGLRAVQAYVYVGNGGVEGLREGYYYYHPEAHRLYAIQAGPRVEESVFCAYDRPAFARAGFALFLIAQMEAIQPLYSNASPVLAVVEAGYMAQALMAQCPAFGLGLRPVEGVDFAAIQGGFQLDPSHRFLHGLLGGITAQTNLPAKSETLLEYLKSNRIGVHAHCAGYQGENTFAHFLRAENIEDILPTPDRKEALHREKLHLRPFERDAKSVDLKAWEAEAGYYLLRSAKRVYREGPVAFGRFSRFLALLAADTRTGAARYLYPSLTGMHPLKVFVYVKAGGVENVAEGLYRYDGVRHELRLVTRAMAADLKTCYTPFNRKHYQLSKFCLFLVGPTAELKPVFGEDSGYFAFLESGYIGQLLLDRQAEFNIGVCPIGGMRYEKIRGDFNLEAEDVFLHSFVGGEVALECEIPWEPLESGPEKPRQPLPQALSEPRPALPANRAIALVGLSGRFPGAEDLAAFARNLKTGKRSFKELRFDLSGAYRGATPGPDGAGAYRHWGGFLEDVDCFDAALFHITPAEARTIDPQERLFLEVAWECLENSGYTGGELNRTAAKVGVFVGAMWDDYQHFQSATRPPSGAGEAISAHHASIANRVSFFFDFKGPSVAVNSSCSSAMTALHLACQSLLSGECHAALAGGVNLMAHPYHQWVLSAAELLSADEVCRPFGQQANGWVAGEGVGAVLLKPLGDAVRDGDTIHAVILGSSIAHSGRTRRYGAPSSTRPAETMREVLEKAGISAQTISYVEAAAPGAGMADAAEAAAIKEVFGAAGGRGSVVHVGSVKGNIGHLESASAMSQLAKVVLQLKQSEIFPTPQFPPLNPLLRWQGAALKIPDALVAWPAGGGGAGPRRALINAFGATGSGGHLVLEEHLAPVLPDHEVETVIPLSAATREQLNLAARRLRDYLDQPGTATARISDIGFTLRTGREPMKARLAMVVHSRRELSDKLAGFLEGAALPPGAYVGEVLGNSSSFGESASADPHTVAANWVAGVGSLGRGKEAAGARRVPLPVYPFAKERYWVGAQPQESSGAALAASATQRLAVETYLREVFSKVTEIPPSRIDARAMFDAYGMTSLMVKRINEIFAKDFGKLSPALLFERQTIEELVEYFLSQHASKLQSVLASGAWNAPLARPDEAPRVKASPRLEPASLREPEAGQIAIVGVSGKYPQAATLAAFWENLKNGVDCISEIPASRWDDARVQSQAGKHCRWGGFLDGVDEFDPFFFKISPKEAQEMDPQERLFLQTVWHLFEDAGYAPSDLRRHTQGRVGVFVGVMYGEYQLHSRWGEANGGGQLVTSLYGSIANRISYVFDFHGPSMAVDTLCSSSLTALHLAVQSVRSGECEAAVAGGVNLSIHPQKYLLHAQSAMSASDGRCRSFGQGGDGFVPGEGVGAVLVKPLAHALRDGDQIYAIIRATAINQDGKTHGYTVPNPNAQAALITEAIRKSGVDPRAISYVEAHGTGTSLGDPIEILGLTKAFGEFTADTQFCALGSVKSNIGHLEAAAGMAGLTKILLQMRHGQLVPSLHSRQLNPEISFETTPFYVSQTLTDWARPRFEKAGVSRTFPRLACLSSFGAGGANAHAILEEFVPGETPAPANAAEPQLIVISAKDEARLRETMAQLRDFTRPTPACRLVDLAFTLQVGREAMEERVAFVAASFAELSEQLEAILEGGKEPLSVYRGTVDRNKSPMASLLEDDDLQGALQAWIDKRKFDQILRAWVGGVQVDWRRLHGHPAPRKVSLPLYPFARERYWVPVPVAQWGATAALGQLHPLLHRNTSDWRGLRFSSTFDGGEFFFAEHRLGGERVLPAAACLEMARAAVAQAAGGQAGQVRLRHVVWIQPFTISQPGRMLHASLQAAEPGGIRFEIYTGESPESKMAISQGSAQYGAPEASPQWDLAGLRESIAGAALSPDQCYETFRSFGLEHGAAFRCLRDIRRNQEAVLARVTLPAAVAATQGDFILHPSLLDGLFQATLALSEPASSSQPAIPYALDELICYQPCAEEMWAYVRPASSGAGKLDLDLCDASGRVCVRVLGFSTRAIEADRAPRPVLLRPISRDSSLANNGSTRSWKRHFIVLIGLEPALAIDLATGLSGATCVPLQPGEGDLAVRFETVATQVFELVKRMLSEMASGDALLQVLTSSAADGRIFRGLGGLLQTAHQENPAFAGQIIELDAPLNAATILGVVSENCAHSADGLVMYEGNRRTAIAWEPLPPSEAPVPMPWKNRGVYLLTGGAGGLARWFAREIVRQTESCVLILAGRSPLTPEGESWRRALERPGTVIEYRQVDVSQGDAVRALVRDILQAHGTLHGILHAAGVVRDHFILQKTAEELRGVLAPKVMGAVNLDVATRDVALDFFALFSSTSGALGNAGQADYAAANGFLDAFAGLRNAQVQAGKRQGHTFSVNWPLWKEGGMKVSEAMLKVLARESQMEPLETARGVEAFARAMASGLSQVMVQARCREAICAPRPEAPTARTPAPVLPAVVDSAGVAFLREPSLQFFKELLASTIRCGVERVKADEPFDSYGIDSVMVMQMTNELEKMFGSLSKTLFFEHHTIQSLAGYFLEHRSGDLRRMFADKPETAPAAASLQVHPVDLPAYRPMNAFSSLAAPSSEALDIAVIGLAGRYPQAGDLDAFWKNLSQGKDSITEFPPGRWDWKPFFGAAAAPSGNQNFMRGGFLDNVDAFDPLFFNIAPSDARYMDPQERLFLEAAWTALEDAGYRPRDLRGSPGQQLPGQVGVYAGVMYSEYQLFAHERTLAGYPTVVGNIYASIANRVSYCLDLHGPSITLDTMCSSSLTGIQLACRDLQDKRTDLALAGGVNVTIHPNKYLLLREGQFISKKGCCGSFGRDGDGYVPGEGVGVAVLKRLADAVRDGDHIYGVIKGAAVNHGGKTNGFTVPNPEAQGEVISRAMKMAGVDPARVTYVEAHSTGTPLGDPIEIAGLSKAFKSAPAVGTRCYLGSVKSNIGHCEAAAGIAGLTKVLLQMKHGQLAPSLHSENLNPHLNLEPTPFRVNQSLRDWERPMAGGQAQPYVAGISGFGAGGSNAHIIVEEYVTPPPSASESDLGPWIIVLSARNEKRLLEMAGRLQRFLQAIPSFSLRDVAYTLQVGREPMEERLGFIVHSHAELFQLLAQVSPGAANGKLRRGRAGGRGTEMLRDLAHDGGLDLNATLARWIRQGKWEKLLDLWVGGVDLDWRTIQGAARPRRISLPAYPFARDRYWLPGIDAPAPTPTTRNHHAALPDVPESKAASWLAVNEEWVPAPWPEAMDRKARLRLQAGKRVALLMPEEIEGRELKSLIAQWEAAAGPNPGVIVDIVPLDGLEQWSLEPVPEVILIAAPEAGNVEQDQRHVSAIYHLSQKLMREAWPAPIRIFHIYSQPEDRPRLRLAALGGLLRSAMLENENHVWTSIAIPENTRPEARRQTLLREWLADEGQRSFSAIRHQGSERRKHRLVEAPAGSGGEAVFRKQGTYLLAGGLGPVGERLCGELARRYQARLVLLSRGDLDAHKREQCRQLEALGARVSYFSVDVAGRSALEAMWPKMKSEAGAIHGVIHLARRVEDGLMLAKSWQVFEQVIQSKVDGTLNLDELTAAEPLDFFLLFSSMAAFGVRGSADYGYSSAFQNTFAAERARQVGVGARAGKSLACGWGPWGVDKYQPPQRDARAHEAGYDLIEMAGAFPWIESRCWQKEPFLGLMQVRDRDRVRQQLGLEGDSHSVAPGESALADRLAEWERRKREGGRITAAEISGVLRSDQVGLLSDAMAGRLHALLHVSPNGNGRVHLETSETPATPATLASTPESGGDLIATVKRCLAELLELDEVEDTKPFQEYGMDSISGLRFSMFLEKKLKFPVSPQWLMEHPTPRALADRLADARDNGGEIKARGAA